MKRVILVPFLAMIIGVCCIIGVVMLGSAYEKSPPDGSASTFGGCPIRVTHLDEQHVTCYTFCNSGISCLRDEPGR